MHTAAAIMTSIVSILAGMFYCMNMTNVGKIHYFTNRSTCTGKSSTAG